MMHFLGKLEERGALNEVEGGDAVSYVVPSIVPGDLPGGFPTRYSAKTVLSVGAGRTGECRNKLLPQSPVPETEA